MHKLSRQDLNNVSKEQLLKIGHAIYDYRYKHGISQDHLADRANVSQSTLERLEAGGNISVERLARISAVTGIKFRINN